MKYRLNEHVEEFIDSDAEMTAHWVFTEEGKPLSRFDGYDNEESANKNNHGKAVLFMGGVFVSSVIFLIYAVAKHSFLM